MSRDVRQIEADARTLAPRDRARLVRRLIASLDVGEDIDAEQIWLDEAEKRLAAYRRGEIAAVPGDEVFGELLKTV
ncbi:MAG: addiction module protein [Gammaproteobacteria bacterium]|nr:MAG: addiction module protein [Gammaproteobacteria bacterium]